MKTTIATISATLALATALHAQTADECADARPVFGPGSFGFDTTNATTSAPAWPCGPGTNDVWFRWLAPHHGTFAFATCAGTAFDTTLEVFGGGCGSIVSLACSDDACGPLSSASLAGVVGGEEYLVRVGGVAGATGPGVLTVTASPDPIFDRQLLVSGPSAGAGGADISERHHCVLAYQTNAFRQSDRLIDDFTVPAEPDATGWEVTRLRVYAIGCSDGQGAPGSIPESTLTRLSLAVWQGVPYSAGSVRLFGDTTTNVLADTGWTGIYRVSFPGFPNETAFPIMYAEARIALFLPEDATYFLEWGIDDSDPNGVVDDPLGTCLNLPATPPNPGLAGNGLHIVRGNLPRTTDPRLYGCISPTGGLDDLPFRIWATPSISVRDALCAPSLNSSGSAAELVLGGPGLAGQPVTAFIGDGPPGNFGYCLSGPNPGLYVVPPGAAGAVCIAAPQYRYNNQTLAHVFQFDAGGVSRVGGGGPAVLQTDGSFGPVPAVAVGETRWFQAWYRDLATSSFTGSRGVTFR
ncbi:MAG: hypothetical protein GY711_08810 [bacterium]|nr:hypothetical protein [bacterium]